MSKLITIGWLHKYNFKEVGGIFHENDQIDLKVKDTNRNKGIYLWLKEKKSSQFEIHYVGKAGSGPQIRMAQHKQGINKPGNQDRKERIAKSIGSKKNDHLKIWFRESPMHKTDLSDREVSLYSIEEESLIEKYNPPLNRTKRSANRDIDGIESELLEAGGGQYEIWSYANTKLHSKQFNSTLLKLRKEFTSDVWDEFEFKVIGKYTNSTGKIPKEFAGKPLLVFGKIADVNFKEKYVLIALDAPNKIAILNKLLAKNYRTIENDFSVFAVDKLKDILLK